MGGSAQEAMALAQKYPPEQMQIVQTSYEKEDQLVQQTVGEARNVGRRINSCLAYVLGTSAW